MKFNITNAEQKRIDAWLEKLNPDILEALKQVLGSEYDLLTNNGTEPYSGPTGGRLTYRFTPTSLGCIVIVTDNITKGHLDLTPYSMW